MLSPWGSIFNGLLFFQGPDVYSTFSSDSGNVADYSDGHKYAGRRHHVANMPKTRSVPEYMMDSCSGEKTKALSAL